MSDFYLFTCFKGRLLCGDQPAGQVRVKLMDDDFGPDPDDQLDSKYTDADGNFDLSGVRAFI